MKISWGGVWDDSENIRVYLKVRVSTFLLLTFTDSGKMRRIQNRVVTKGFMLDDKKGLLR